MAISVGVDLLSTIDTQESGIRVLPDASADAEYVSAARRGDMRAFERLYRLYCDRVYGLCWRMTRRREVAEDCVQTTFVRAWRSLASFEGRSAFLTWLYRIAVNEVLTHARNHSTRSESDEEAVLAHDRGPMGPAVFDALDVVDVERALALLPEGARHAIVLQTVYGYSHEEVAEMLGVAIGTCKAQVHRGRRLLRQHLGMPEVET